MSLSLLRTGPLDERRYLTIAAIASTRKTVIRSQMKPIPIIMPLDMVSYSGHRELHPAQISLFKIGLGCEAAAGLGCGVKAKPILQALTRDPVVAQAWLNRS